jgi:hypothetical protein
MKQLSHRTAAILEVIRRYEVMGHECSEFEIIRLAWLFDKQLLQAGIKGQPKTFFTNNKNDESSNGINLFLESVLDTYLSEVQGISGETEHRVFGISQRQGKLISRHFKKISSEFKSAVESVGQTIDGYESPYGLSVLVEAKKNKSNGAEIPRHLD